MMTRLDALALASQALDDARHATAKPGAVDRPDIARLHLDRATGYLELARQLGEAEAAAAQASGGERNVP